MKKITLLFSTLLVSLFSGSVVAQQVNSGVIVLSPTDTTICPGQTITLHGGFASSFGEISTDDIFSDQVIDIGFPFTFFDDVYSKCVLSANNFISFDTSYAGDYSSWVYNAGNKANTQLGNSIMFPFHDIDMGLGLGEIRFQTFGAAPNRVFVVEFCKTPLFSCNSLLVTDQLVLFEGTNIIEHHLGDKPTCTGWQQGTAIQGLIGNNGTDEVFVPGRGTINTPWTVAQDGRRFTPDGSGGYTIDSIPYNPRIIIPGVDSTDLIWYEEGNPIPIGTGASIAVTPTADITYYVAQITGQNGCLGDSTYSFFDTVYIYYATTYDTINTTICNGESYNFYGKELYTPGQYDTLFSSAMGCDSSITLNLGINPLPDVTIGSLFSTIEVCEGNAASISLANPLSGNTYQWLKDGYPMAGETEPTLVLQDPGIYTVEVTTDKGCIATSLPYTFVVHPTPEAAIEPINGDILCTYDTVTLSAVIGPNYDYRWSPEAAFRLVTGAEGQTVKGIFNTPHTVVNLTVYNEFGCYDSASVDVFTKPCCEVFTPSAFSPNGDGVNDYFMPHLQPGQILTGMVVYDRFGKMVYNNTNVKQGWDGSYEDGAAAPQDVYMYMIQYTCDDGKDYERKESITLIR